ncbi:MAG: hypothetical protein AB8B55_13480 [Mariniblastus sp.]
MQNANLRWWQGFAILFCCSCLYFTGMTLFFIQFDWTGPNQWPAIFVWGNIGMVAAVLGIVGFWLTLRKSPIVIRLLTFLLVAVPSLTCLVFGYFWAKRTSSGFGVENEETVLEILFAFTFGVIQCVVATMVPLIILRFMGRSIVHANEESGSATISIAEILSFVTSVAVGFACLERSGDVLPQEIRWIVIGITLAVCFAASLLFLIPQCILLSVENMRFGIRLTAGTTLLVAFAIAIIVEGVMSGGGRYFPVSWEGPMVPILCIAICYSSLVILVVSGIRLLGYKMKKVA